MYPRHYPTRRFPSNAFTLIELLVVVAIIVLLISVLLPSLAKARKLAKTVKCASQLHSICQAMMTYATEYNQAILGNVHTSGSFLLDTTHVPKYSDTYCPTICQCWDWSAPCAYQMNLAFEQGYTAANRRTRFQQLNNMSAFICPENDILSPTYNGSSFPVPTTAMISFNTALMFQYEYGTPTNPSLPYDYQDYINTGGYAPKLNSVGNLSSKIFIADGARWSDDGTTPSVQLNYLGSGSSPGGCYGDYGPWSQYSRAYLHDANSKDKTGITYAMRHGSRSPGALLSAYKFNAGFFDGHVETLSGDQGEDPALWVPSGTTIPATEFAADALAKYHVSGAGFVAP